MNGQPFLVPTTRASARIAVRLRRTLTKETTSAVDGPDLSMMAEEGKRGECIGHVLRQRQPPHEAREAFGAEEGQRERGAGHRYDPVRRAPQDRKRRNRCR